jgi:hypothetical protein
MISGSGLGERIRIVCIVIVGRAKMGSALAWIVIEQ